MKMFKKMWNAISEDDRKVLMIRLTILVSLLFSVWSFRLGRKIVDVSVVLMGEINSSVIGKGNDLFAFAFTTTQTQGKEPQILSSDVENLINSYIHAQVVDFCENEDSESGVFILVEIWADGDADHRKACVPANSFFSVSRLEDSYWDGVNVNGFKDSDWTQFVVAPFVFEPSPEPTPRPVP